MKKILLACNAGMSTSMLVQKMRAAAKEMNVDADINALSLTEAMDRRSSSSLPPSRKLPQAARRSMSLTCAITA